MSKPKKQLDAEYYQRNKEKVKARVLAYRTQNKEAVAQKQKAYYEANKEHILTRNGNWAKQNRHVMNQRHKEYVQRNRGKWAAQTALYRAKRRKATPPWADLQKIKELYKHASAWNEIWPDDRVDVDHIIPVRSDLVCGLHTHQNLRIIRSYENKKKSNRLYE